MFLFLLGLPDELIQKGKDIKSISEIEETGDNFKVTVTTGSNVLVNTFTIGKEAELDTITGEKVKVSQDTKVECDHTPFLNPFAYLAQINLYLASCS